MYVWSRMRRVGRDAAAAGARLRAGATLAGAVHVGGGGAGPVRRARGPSA